MYVENKDDLTSRNYRCMSSVRKSYLVEISAFSKGDSLTTTV